VKGGRKISPSPSLLKRGVQARFPPFIYFFISPFEKGGLKGDLKKEFI